MEWKEKKEKIKWWYCMGGWIDWGLNIYLALQPACNNFYSKLKGWCDSLSQIWIDNNIHNDFKWALQILQQSSGVHLLKSILWSTDEATTTILCDACPSGMGFWNPVTNQGFILPTPHCYNFWTKGRLTACTCIWYWAIFIYLFDSQVIWCQVQANVLFKRLLECLLLGIV